MSHQLTFADSEFSSKRRQTRKEIFLSRMEQILPWQNMVEVIEPFYPKAGSGRRPYPLETMLRIHCMQHWYNLSDGAAELWIAKEGYRNARLEMVGEDISERAGKANIAA